MTQMKKTMAYAGKSKKTFFVAAFLILALVVFLNLPKSKKDSALAQAGGAEMPPALVRVKRVGTLTGTQPVPKVAPVVTKESVAIVPRVSGYLTKIAFQEGDFVNKGDLLFEIEDTIYKNNVDIAKAVVVQIEAELALAKSNHERVQRMTVSKSATDQDLDEAIRATNYQQGRLDEAKAKLRLAETDLSYTKIYAPLSGRVGRRQYSEGNYLTPQSGVMATIMQCDPVNIEFNVTEKEFMTYFHEHGEQREASIEVILANGQPYEGKYKIDFIDNFVDRHSGQIMVYLICDNADNKLTPGGFSTVKLSEQFEKPLPAANVTALMTDGVTHYVYVVDKNNKIERRDIKLGAQVFDRQIVMSGLAPDERIVVGGLNKVRPGEMVTPIEAQAPAVTTEKPVEQLAGQKNVDTGKQTQQVSSVVQTPTAVVVQPIAQPVVVATPVTVESKPAQ